MSIENVKAFYKELANNPAFRHQIENIKNKTECSQLIKAAGYNFTLEEYEEYTAQLLESAADESELQDLNEKELAAVFGGLIGGRNSYLIYGAPGGLWDFYYF